MKHGEREAGFALLDALVALAIIGVIAAVFAEAVQGTTMARRKADVAIVATQLARTRLDLALEHADLAVSGQEGGFAWNVMTEPYRGSDNGPGLELVRVDVTRPGNRAVLARLETLRLAR